jgi:signal transduction histidine kinase
VTTSNRILWVSVWGIALPTLALLFLGVRAAFHGRELAELRLEAMVRDQAEAAADRVSKWVSIRAEGVLGLAAEAVASDAEWRRAFERIEAGDPVVSHLFMVDADGKLRWPEFSGPSLIHSLTAGGGLVLPMHLGLGLGESASQPVSEGASPGSRETHYRAALKSFQPLLRQSDPWLRALALDLTARCHVALEEWDEALAAYDELGEKYGGIADAGGVPLELGVRYEVAFIHGRLGQRDQLVEGYLAAYEELVAHRVPVAWELRRYLCDVTREALREALSDGAAWPELADRFERLQEVDLQDARRETFLTQVWVHGLSRELGERPNDSGQRHGRFRVNGKAAQLYWASAGGRTVGFQADMNALGQALAADDQAPDSALLDLGMVSGESRFVVSGSPSGGDVVEVPVAAAPEWRVVMAAPAEGTAGEGNYLYGWLAALSVLALALGVTALVRTSRTRLQTAQLQSDFVSAVSHELRTPLTSMRLFSEMLVQDAGDGGVAQQQRFAESIQRECRRLEHLVQNILTFALSERNKLSVTFENLDVGEVVRRAVSNFEPLAAHQGVDIDVEVSDQLPGILADADRLESVVFDLLDNAVRYGPREGHVEVSVRGQNGSVVLAVADRGPGVPVRERKRIFRPFYRGAEAVARGQSGTGLGLALVQRIALAHGGGVTVEARAEGGTVFSVSLPARKDVTDGRQLGPGR